MSRAVREQLDEVLEIARTGADGDGDEPQAAAGAATLAEELNGAVAARRGGTAQDALDV